MMPRDYGAFFDNISAIKKKEGVNRVLRLMTDALNGKDKAILAIDWNHSCYVLGDLYWRQGDFRRALAAFKKSWRANRRDEQALLAMGNCCSELQNMDSRENVIAWPIGQASIANVFITICRMVCSARKHTTAAVLYEALVAG